MKRIILAFVAVALLASSASAGGVTVRVGGLFNRQVVVQRQGFIAPRQGFVQIRRSVPTVFLGRNVYQSQVVREVPVYSQRVFAAPAYGGFSSSFGYAPVQTFGFSGGYGNVQTFAAPVGGCGSFLSLGVGY